MYKLSSDANQNQESKSAEKYLNITLDLSEQVKNNEIACLLKTKTATSN